MEASPPTIRLAAVADLAAIDAIYNHYVLTSTCTFQVEPDGMDERSAWFASHGRLHPVFVAEAQTEVVGWASISPHKSRCAYGHTVEDSVYIRQDWQGRGVGRALLGRCVDVARDAGHHVLLAGVAADQVPSIRLHESLGFRPVAHFKELGYKFGRWIDVLYFQLMLGGSGPTP